MVTQVDRTVRGEPSVTVVVPCRGRHELVAEVVDTLLALGCPTVLVDDGSEPPLSMIVHPRLEVIRQDPLGAGPARNRGVESCRSEWIAFTDSDTVWTDATRDRLDHLAATTPAGTWVCGETIVPASERTISAAWMRHLADKGRPPAGTSTLPLATGLLLCRRQELQAVGGFLAAMTGCGGEDWELGQRARAHGYRIVFDPGWQALNLDRPFTFRRLLAREENFARQRRALRDQGVDTRSWVATQPARLRDRLLRPLGSGVVVGALDRLASLPDVGRTGAFVWPLLRGATSATVRRGTGSGRIA